MLQNGRLFVQLKRAANDVVSTIFGGKFCSVSKYCEKILSLTNLGLKTIELSPLLGWLGNSAAKLPLVSRIGNKRWPQAKFGCKSRNRFLTKWRMNKAKRQTGSTVTAACTGGSRKYGFLCTCLTWKSYFVWSRKEYFQGTANWGKLFPISWNLKTGHTLLVQSDNKNRKPWTCKIL